jgi:hypothetical protein
MAPASSMSGMESAEGTAAGRSDAPQAGDWTWPLFAVVLGFGAAALPLVAAMMGFHLASFPLQDAWSDNDYPLFVNPSLWLVAGLANAACVVLATVLRWRPRFSLGRFETDPCIASWIIPGAAASLFQSRRGGEGSGIHASAVTLYCQATRSDTSAGSVSCTHEHRSVVIGDTACLDVAACWHKTPLLSHPAPESHDILPHLASPTLGVSIGRTGYLSRDGRWETPNWANEAS